MSGNNFITKKNVQQLIILKKSDFIGDTGLNKWFFKKIFFSNAQRKNRTW